MIEEPEHAQVLCSEEFVHAEARWMATVYRRRFEWPRAAKCSARDS